MRGSRGLALVVAGIAALVLAAPVGATFPGRNGFLVFISDRDGDFDLYAQNLDGSSFRKLLERPGTTEGNPSWSPSGKRLVLHSGPPDQSDFDLYLLNANGTGLTPLLLGPTNDVNPQFCDEDTVVFQRVLSATNSDVYAIETDGTGLRVVTDHPAFDFGPTCRPDGTAVAFASTRALPVSIHELPLPPAVGRSLAGAEPTLLVARALDPDYSPDGKALAYAGSDPLDGSVEVFVRNLATGATRQVSSSAPPFVNRFPRFFPDQGGGAARAPAGDDLSYHIQYTTLEDEKKSTHANVPPCDQVGRLARGPQGIAELCFAVVANGGVAAIRPLLLVPTCRCKDLTVGVPKASFGAAEGRTAGSRLTRLFFSVSWGLTCSAGRGENCRATFSLGEPEGFTIRSMHRLEKRGKKTVRVPDPNPVSCQGQCSRSRETTTDGTVRVALDSSRSLDDLAGESFTLELETNCSGKSDTTRILVTMGTNGRVKGVRVEQ